MKIISFHDGFSAIRKQLKELNKIIGSSESLSEGAAFNKKELLNSIILDSINQSEREKEQILNSLMEQVCYMDLDYNIRWLNEAGLKTVSPETSIDDIIGQPCYRVWYGKTRPCEACPVSTTLKTGWPWKDEITYPDGSTKLVSSQPVLDENGKMKGVIEVELDITMRKNAERALEKSQRRSEALLDSIPDLFIVFNDSGIFIDYHPTADLDIITETKNPEGKPITRILPEKLAKQILKNTQSLNDVNMSRNFEFNETSISADTYFECRLIKIGENENVCIIRDISRQKNREKQILHKSFHDKLTGLYNRAYFEEELNRIEQSRQALPTSIVIIDVNGLKFTNDAFGHDFGDRLLKVVADILFLNCRKSDVIARTGGDEFSIILPNSPMAKAEKLSTRIIEACRNSNYDDIFARPSVSVGCAERTNTSISLQNTIKIADERMYEMKLANRSRHLNTIIEDILASMKKQGFEDEEHIKRLVELSENFTKVLNLSAAETEKIKQLSLLHDIGNIRVSDRILSKAEDLSVDELSEIKKHSIIGYRIVKAIPDYASVAELILYHHERWDGKGYPSGLKEKEIPLLSRIFAIVDCFELLTHGSICKQGSTVADTLTQIRENAGSRFDPELSETFISFIKENTV